MKNAFVDNQKVVRTFLTHRALWDIPERVRHRLPSSARRISSTSPARTELFPALARRELFVFRGRVSPVAALLVFVGQSSGDDGLTALSLPGQSPTLLTKAARKWLLDAT